MRLTAESIRIGTGPAAALPPVSFSAAPGEPVVVAVDTGSRPTVLALAASGRMKLDSGLMLVDGESDPDLLRRSVALVDAPTVAEPPEDVQTREIVREELVLARSPHSALAIARLLDSVGASDFAREPFGALPGALRTRLLAELAVLRSDVRAVAITAPERHGGDPRDLLALIKDLSDRDYAVLTITSAAVAAALEEAAS
jgi:ABC-2 type transport system ATP-binding protein